MTAMLTTTEVESFAKFSNFKLYSDDDSGTIRTKPYQVIVPVGATIDLDQEHADKARAPDPSSSSSEAHFTQSRGPGGSVISENTIRQRFIETTPKYMRCTDRLSFGHSLEPKRNALGCRYLNPNSQKVVRWQFFDLDRSDAALRFDDANVAVPNAIIENEENGHAHYAYALEVGVVRSADGRTAPQNYLEAIRRGMTRRLGADPHFGHYLAKNPLHPQWRTTWLSTKAHSLNDMSVWLEAEDMRPAHKSRKAEHEFAQEGRNCSLTSDLAKFALRVAWRFKHGAHTLQDYQRGLHVEAFNLNEAFPEPLPFKEVQAIVRSVGKWAWARLDRREILRNAALAGGSAAAAGALASSRAWRASVKCPALSLPTA